MEKKKSFVFYYDWRDILVPLGNERVGELMCAVLKYVCDKEETDFQDVALKISYNFIVNAIKRDEEKYQDICEKNAKNGKLGGRPKKANALYKNQTLFEKPKKADNDNDNDNENENDNVNNTLSPSICHVQSATKEQSSLSAPKEQSSSPSKKGDGAYNDLFLSFWSEYPKKVGKGEAYKQWKRLRLSVSDMERVKQALSWQKRSREWLESGGRFIPNPSTYLSQRRWEDEPLCSRYGGDITNPSAYNDGDELPEFIIKGDFLYGSRR